MKALGRGDLPSNTFGSLIAIHRGERLDDPKLEQDMMYLDLEIGQGGRLLPRRFIAYELRKSSKLEFAVAPIVIGNARVQYVCAAANKIMSLWGGWLHEEVEMPLTYDRSHGMKPRKIVLSDGREIRHLSVKSIPPELCKLGHVRFEVLPADRNHLHCPRDQVSEDGGPLPCV